MGAHTKDIEDSNDEDRNASSEDTDTESSPSSSPWAEKLEKAEQLWEAGDNAALRTVLDELEKAPTSEKELHLFVATMRKRLKPDPIAIGLWGLTLFVFCLLTYLFILRR